MFAGGFTGTGFTEPMRTCAKGAAERFVSSTYVRLHAYGTRKGGIIFDMASIWKYLTRILVLGAGAAGLEAWQARMFTDG